MSDLSRPASDYDLPWDALVTKAVRHLQLQTALQDRFMNLREAAWSVDLRAGNYLQARRPGGGGAGPDRRHL